MYTIKEAATKMDISEHTLRFWAKSNLFPSLQRDKNNVRLFTETDLGWIKMIKCLRSVGTENKAIKQYIDFCLIGDSTIPERYEIIKTTKAKAIMQMEELQNQMTLLDYKENYYKDLINNNLNDKYNPANTIAAVS